MLQQTLEAEGHEKLDANRFGVVTQYIPVATRTKLLHQNFVVTLSKFVTTEFKKELKEQVVKEECMLRQMPATMTEKICRGRTFYVVTKRPIWAIIFGIHNIINEVKPNIRNPINRRF